MKTENRNYLRFSLVTPTMNRNKDLFELLDTLQKQTYQNFEMIIVDLNTDDLLSRHDFSGYNFPVCVTRPGKRLNASEARNYGFRFVKGEIVSFPDDDCWYEKDVLERVKVLFQQRAVDMVTMGANDPISGKSIHKFLRESKILKSGFDIPKAGIEYAMFLKKEAFASLAGFDENISPGSSNIFQAGEAMDLLFRSLSSNQKIYFDSSLLIYHPYKLNLDFTSERNLKVILDKHYKYAAAFGYVMFKNKQLYPFLYYLLRSVGALGRSIVSFDSKRIKLEWYNLKGRLVGYVKGLRFEKRYSAI